VTLALYLGKKIQQFLVSFRVKNARTTASIAATDVQDMYFQDFLPLIIWRISDQYYLIDFLPNGVAHFIRINREMYFKTRLKITTCPKSLKATLFLIAITSTLFFAK
jgi:hypothetical protein